jgi:tetratricopeptide (TPR) repeat protein
VPDTSALDLARRALDEVGESPARSRQHAQEALRLEAAGRPRDPRARSVAWRADGLALRDLGDIVGADRSVARAAQVARRAGLGQEAAEALMTLAFVRLIRGRPANALQLADRAATSLTGVAGARLAAQRGLILQRCGRFDEALVVYGQALPVLVRAHDTVWEARLRTNRGLLYAYRQAFGSASTDLLRTLELHRTAGRTLDVAATLWNLGFVAGRQGDLPNALARFDEAAAVYSAEGAPSPEFLTDRCEVLLAAGLVREARRTAVVAVEQLEAAGQHADLAEARLMLAQASLAAGEPQAAESAAVLAEAQFIRQRRRPWALIARYTAMAARRAAGGATSRDLAAALRCADDLARSGWRVAEADTRLVAAAIALDLDRPSTAKDQLARTARWRADGPLDLRVRAWYAQAQLRRQAGDLRGTWSALRAGLRAVEGVQATLGATELRVHVGHHAQDLVGLGVSLALDLGRPRTVLGWAEQWRATSTRLRPVRAPREKGLADALAEVRRAAAAVEEARLDGRPARLLEATLRDAQEHVRSVTRTLASPEDGRPSHEAGGLLPDRLRSSLGDRVLLEYVESGGALHLVTVDADGVRMHALGSVEPVRAAADSLDFALRRLASQFGTPDGLAGMRRLAELTAAELQAALVPDEVAARLNGTESVGVVVVPSESLHGLPWAALPLLVEAATSVAPSAAAWLRAASGGATDTRDGGGPVVLTAGPDLVHAPLEVGRVAALYPRSGQVTVLGPADARADAVLAAADGAALLHLAAHGTLEEDNPLFSSLRLADGPLTVYDLEQLDRAPRTVLLPACRSGLAGLRAGNESMGLATALLALGSSSVVAAVIPVPDAATADLMVRVHRGLRSGLGPARALADARSEQASEDADDHGAYAARVGFVTYGA